ncbi:hypothetical protein CHL76_02190 [Marinococcus halophilus]|uniref:Uncharacterized protein n=1 Tax=Marinococcus halophilus TaxID=1371 RepID=A0A510Y1G5_MARHA|nr:hypothetical protein [Marinococcus halophilus]OZT81186.1 hypothetical protein CHL76_02190 [Marinococcus halophilus]GEK57119.1 hypothetical protein MHA01_00240 [Marinococcus halophilus]
MAISKETANTYFEEEVFDNAAWTNANESDKDRALKNASNVLYRYYSQFDPERRPIPDEAVFEQAIWLLKVSEARKQSEQGVTSYSIDGISVQLSQIDRTISPQVKAILGRRVGRSVNDRVGYIDSNSRKIERRDRIQGRGFR